ncbi:hydroxymethylglutaryl-CoA reductase, degradative [Zeaxanthinibacter sp. PT1]|uniref:hydroxymethylglutaryl-CoA reductase, degradative n=1 Tax=Zeaxanthinibacter TaxID=561554 RepID=UPI00234BB49C|nr:hydroxymethylglutaryl-CoA reductase, degradative [Zeaxanthinibacter sp. PT1]MDC6351224.1 hydroxymethylglutaryl-CoA reductase, degradative [Zeaxanthinibacter sp. PT1]
MTPPIEGFSKLSKEEKINWIAERFTDNSEETKKILKRYWNQDAEVQQLHDEFIENTISNYYLPLGIAPNFLINGRIYAIPMAIEESSVVAAASKAAKFWLNRGGFTAEVLGTEKIGQVHFTYSGDAEQLATFVKRIIPVMRSDVADLTAKMEKRGGGVKKIELVDKRSELSDYFQLHCTFETADAMGANFINSCLEQFAQTLEREAKDDPGIMDECMEVVMSILSNYVPGCTVRAEVSCKIEELDEHDDISPVQFAEKMVQAVAIAKAEPFRAVTHNKGIMNGIDSVVLATGNDFRAVEAGIHAYASKDGRYTSLTHAAIENGIFKFWIEIPLALGTVGGLTGLHPMVRLSLDILQNPSARQLMQIAAVAGLAQNFAALRSLVTTGIQQGHMKMHLLNILNQLQASTPEKTAIVQLFRDQQVTHRAVAAALEKLRTA